MRLLNNVLLAGALIFGFILVEHHYHIADRLWQFRDNRNPQPNRPKSTPPPAISASPSPPGESALPKDHDYQLVIDVSGKGPFMTVVHGPVPAEKKITKRSKRQGASQQVASKDQAQVAPQPATPPLPQTPVPQSLPQAQAVPVPQAAPSGAKSQ